MPRIPARRSLHGDNLADPLVDPCRARPISARADRVLLLDTDKRPMDAWPRCLERLEAELPAEDVHTWLKPLQASRRDDTTVLYAPNAFVVEFVRERYLDRIRELLSHFAGSGEVSLEVGSLPRAAVAAVTAPRSLALDSTIWARVSKSGGSIATDRPQASRDFNRGSSPSTSRG